MLTASWNLKYFEKRSRFFNALTFGSVGQRAAKLLAVKVWGQKKILPSSPVRTRFARAGPFGRILFWPPTLMANSSAAVWPTETHSTSFKRSKPPLLTQALSKSLEALLMYLISIQSTLISIGFISKGAIFVGPICMLLRFAPYSLGIELLHDYLLGSWVAPSWATVVFFLAWLVLQVGSSYYSMCSPVAFARIE